VDKMQCLQSDLRFYRLDPIPHGMKKTSQQLLVGTQEKLARVARHWVAVNSVLPAECPLLLLRGVTLEEVNGLVNGFPALRQQVAAAEAGLKLGRGHYEQRKAVLHRWLRDINIWMRGTYHYTPFFAMVHRVPGRGQGYQHWWNAAIDARAMWRLIVAGAPVLLADGTPRRVQFSDGRTLEQFEEVVEEFEAAWRALYGPKIDLKLARGAVALAHEKGAALLMAYGHGVRARLGNKGRLVRTIPKVWPGRKGA